jgi:hypothetical protein
MPNTDFVISNWKYSDYRMEAAMIQAMKDAIHEIKIELLRWRLIVADRLGCDTRGPLMDFYAALFARSARQVARMESRKGLV